MNEIEKLLIDRYKEFWYDIYNIEKEEVKKLKEYVDYVEKELREYRAISYNYNDVCSFFYE